MAAHSTVRALYAAYSGPLYTVQRARDNATLDVSVLSPGGFANAAAQDNFCGGTSCIVLRIMDQSPYGNHIGTAPGGGAAPAPDRGVNASALRLSVGGHAVYAAYFQGGQGYRNDTTTGVAKGNTPQSMYMVTSGSHFNDACCFDYGNAETDNHDNGAGTMEAIYWGNCSFWGRGEGAGPWIMADLENGLWAGNTTVQPQPPMVAEYVFAMVKGATDGFTIKGGDANGGSLATLFDGPRPAGYQPMNKQGAIILGIGGDNSDHGVGTFFEGAMTAGFSSDEVDAAVHASVASVGYGK